MSNDGFDGFDNRFLVSHNNCIKTVETKLKPVSVSLNRMRPLDLQKVCDAAYFRFLISLRLLVGLASRRGKILFFCSSLILVDTYKNRYSTVILTVEDHRMEK